MGRQRITKDFYHSFEVADGDFAMSFSRSGKDFIYVAARRRLGGEEEEDYVIGFKISRKRLVPWMEGKSKSVFEVQAERRKRQKRIKMENTT
jgi:hypothetical protein